MRQGDGRNRARQPLLEELIGKELWACRRAAGMATFQFGQRLPVKTFLGVDSEVGEYSLHVQCSWRIVGRDGVIVGSRDLLYPADHVDGESVPDDFHWDTHRSRRDRLIDALFRQHVLVVRAVSPGRGGRCDVHFNDDIELQIAPDDSLSHEHWRLFETAESSRHHIE